MKKTLLVLIIAVMLAAPAAANVFQDSDLSVGLGVGDSLYLTGRMDLDRTFAAVLNVGFGYGMTARGLYLRPQFQYSISELEFDIDVLRFYPYFGGALPLGITGGFDMSVNAVAGLSYYLSDLPMELFIEVLPGVRLFKNSDFKLGFDMGGGIGVRWILGR